MEEAPIAEAVARFCITCIVVHMYRAVAGVGGVDLAAVAISPRPFVPHFLMHACTGLLSTAEEQGFTEGFTVSPVRLDVADHRARCEV